jgi:hypothetical protein
MWEKRFVYRGRADQLTYLGHIDLVHFPQASGANRCYHTDGAEWWFLGSRQLDVVFASSVDRSGLCVAPDVHSAHAEGTWQPAFASTRPSIRINTAITT